MWDATSGGNQIQAVTLQQSGGAPTNRLATVNGVSYTYDAAGNVTYDGSHSYVYDGENRVASLDSGASSYAYDPRNWRVKKVSGGTTTHYVWEGGQVLAEHNGGTGAVLVDYVYAGAALIAKVAGGTTQYLLSDRLSVRVVLDTSGSVVGRQGHLQFGEDFAESGTQEKHHFTSYERDSESALDYAVNRYHANAVGRFTSVDPSAGSPANPQSWNRYAYALNDPLNVIDPLGLFAQPEQEADVYLHGEADAPPDFSFFLEEFFGGYSVPPPLFVPPDSSGEVQNPSGRPETHRDTIYDRANLAKRLLKKSKRCRDLLSSKAGDDAFQTLKQIIREHRLFDSPEVGEEDIADTQGRFRGAIIRIGPYFFQPTVGNLTGLEHLKFCRL